MTVAELGAIGELVGGVAVLVTLVYLAAQIRQNTRSVETAALDSSASHLAAVRQAVFENADVARIFHVGMRNPEELDDEERLRFRLIMHNVFWSCMNSLKQGQLARFADQSREATTTLLARLLESRGATWFWSEFQQEFEASFRDEVNRLLNRS